MGLNVQKMARQIMNDEQLLEILFQTNWSDSEDDFENSDNENEQASIHVPENIGIPSNNVEGNIITVLLSIVFLYFKFSTIFLLLIN